MFDAKTTEFYLVVRNDEEQYSIWWSDRELPAGWHSVGDPAPREECLARIDELWTDMRPLSLRRWMSEHPDD
ncbi:MULTISPECIES: MbtH family NRPS accessory protein [unclassified Streptomyces]|uniref:MbtH family protein n=1 Tax=unclassified Streptomyces TaxID=2593676 RepID=UPI00344BDEAF